MIMAVPERMANVLSTIEYLDADVRVVLDQRRGGNPWATRAKGLESFIGEHGWVLMLQDDVVVCRNLMAACDAIAREATRYCFVSLYASSRCVRELRHNTYRSHRYLEVSDWVSGPASMIRCSEIPSLLEWADRNVPAGYINDDHVMGRYCSTHSPALMVLPSLTDHLDTPSTVHARGMPKRKATMFVGEDFDASSLDYSMPDEIPHLVRDPRRPRSFVPVASSSRTGTLAK